MAVVSATADVAYYKINYLLIKDRLILASTTTDCNLAVQQLCSYAPIASMLASRVILHKSEANY